MATATGKGEGEEEEEEEEDGKGREWRVQKRGSVSKIGVATLNAEKGAGKVSNSALGLVALRLEVSHGQSHSSDSVR